MAKYEVVSLRLDPATSVRLATLAERSGVPRTVIMREMVEQATDLAYRLSGEVDDDQ